MEVSLENVKEISLVTNYVMMGYDPNAYTDLLRVSPGWISYRRINFHTKEVVVEWSYKTKSREFLSRWENLISTFYHEINCPSKKEIITDCGSFNVRVTFKDDTFVDVHGTSDFYASNLPNQAEAFFMMIPHGEECPDFIKPFRADFYEEDLLSENLKQLDLQKVNSLMYAEGGAMGWAGLIEITTEDNVRYNNREKSDIGQMDVFDLFDGLPVYHCSEVVTTPFSVNGRSWYYIGLGAGNHLYLRSDLYFKIADQIFDLRESQRYVNWNKLFHKEIM